MILTLSVGRKLLLHIGLSLIATASLFAQDPQFSQFFANPIYTNPAFAGSSNHGRGVLQFRNQWSSIAGTFTTASASYDEHYDFVNGGLGVIATTDVAGVGVMTTLNLGAMYSYQIVVNRKLTFRAAVQANAVQRSVDFSKFSWYDQIRYQQGFVQPTQEATPTNPTVFYPNFSAGFLAYTKYFYGGFAIHNITEPVQAFYSVSNAPENRVPRRYTVHAGMVIPIREDKNFKKATSISPNILYMQQGYFNQLNLGLYYNKGSYVIGGYFRQNSVNADAFILLLGLKRDKLRIGYSYDATVSPARTGAPSSHEVSIAFELRKRVPKRTVRAMRCPEF